MAERAQVERERYRENVGKEPETRFPDDPDWRYRGTKSEREELERRLEEPVVIEGQEELFE
jgi:hypothetical protein